MLLAPKQPNTLTLGLLLYLSRLSPPQQCESPRGTPGSQAPTFSASSTQGVSLPIPVSPWVTVRPPQPPPFLPHTSDSRSPFIQWFLQLQKAVGLGGLVYLFLTAQSQLTWAGLPTPWWELASSCANAKPIGGPISVASQEAWTLSASCDPRILHCSQDAHWPLTCPRAGYGSTFPSLPFSCLVQSSLASCRNMVPCQMWTLSAMVKWSTHGR